ncbi:MAG: hypothetical protein ACKO34_01375 [Vampirovibrionales bacterium]
MNPPTPSPLPNEAWQEAYAPQLVIPTRYQTLQTAIDDGLQLSKTKAMPPSRIIGDWQSIDTVYAVVDRPLFVQWRWAVLALLEAEEGLASDPWWEFLDTCRVPWFMEVLEGIKLLRDFQREGWALPPIHSGMQ